LTLALCSAEATGVTLRNVGSDSLIEIIHHSVTSGSCHNCPRGTWLRSASSSSAWWFGLDPRHRLGATLIGGNFFVPLRFCPADGGRFVPILAGISTFLSPPGFLPERFCPERNESECSPTNRLGRECASNLSFAFEYSASTVSQVQFDVRVGAKGQRSFAACASFPLRG
jgi:hypothetical protein